MQYNGTNGAEIDAWLPQEYDVKVIQAGPNEKVSLILEIMYPEQFAAKYEPVTP